VRYRLNREKLKEAVCRVVDGCKARDLGAVKLHKVLYYADMLSYLESGKPMTGAVYRKRPFGPTCDALLSVLSELDADGAIQVEEVNYYGYMKREFRPLKPHNYSHLSDREVALLDSMVQFVCYQNTAKSISDFSHDIVWDMVDFGQDIPYHAALNWLPVEVPQEALDEAAAVWAGIENKESVRKATLEGRVLSPLRARLVKHARQEALS